MDLLQTSSPGASSEETPHSQVFNRSSSFDDIPDSPLSSAPSDLEYFASCVPTLDLGNAFEIGKDDTTTPEQAPLAESFEVRTRHQQRTLNNIMQPPITTLPDLDLARAARTLAFINSLPASVQPVRAARTPTLPGWSSSTNNEAVTDPSLPRTRSTRRGDQTKFRGVKEVASVAKTPKKRKAAGTTAYPQDEKEDAEAGCQLPFDYHFPATTARQQKLEEKRKASNSVQAEKAAMPAQRPSTKRSRTADQQCTESSTVLNAPPASKKRRVNAAPSEEETHENTTPVGSLNLRPTPKLVLKLPQPPKAKPSRSRKAPAKPRAPPATVPPSKSVVTAATQDKLRSILPSAERHLVGISAQLTQSVDFSKKLPRAGEPEAWSDNRQAFIETLSYWRAYKSGGYCSGGVARSFMFSKESHHRDYIDEDVVISRAGGGMSKDEATGEMIQGGDQSVTSQVSDVQNNIQNRNPVILILGKGISNVSTEMAHEYNVMDWFKPTDVWHEKSSGHKLIRYRFEKLHDERISWWMPEDHSSPAAVGSLSPQVIKTCNMCGKTSPQVFLQGWMCAMSPDCARFWRLADGTEPIEAELLYDPRFLKKRTAWPHSIEPHPLIPKLPSVDAEDYTLSSWRGIACPKCCCCTGCEDWEYWKCSNPACDFVLKRHHTYIPIGAVDDDPVNLLSTGYSVCRNVCKLPGTAEMKFTQEHRIQKFNVQGTEGYVAHYMATKAAREKSGGPNDLWDELQGTKLGLKRRWINKNGGQQLTANFMHNYGHPYKFVAKTMSTPFDEAPNVIGRAHASMNAIASEAGAITSRTEDFNELLLLAYNEGMAIGFHDDGETGLGPTICTLSIGWRSVMQLRMKAKHYLGVVKSGKRWKYVDAKPIPGCLNYEWRRERWDELETLREDRDALVKRLQELPKELLELRRELNEEHKRKNNSRALKTPKTAPIAITLHLNHGDYVIMHGALIQYYFEHAVSHEGRLRYALTCRRIDGETHLNAGERAEFEGTEFAKVQDEEVVDEAEGDVGVSLDSMAGAEEVDGVNE